jgi:uncharacterized protein YeaO (DUF488 family)
MLIARFRPRYMKKENENWDALYRELAPSRQSRCYDISDRGLPAQIFFDGCPV